MLNRKEATQKRKEELKTKLKVGAFVKNVWGATMQRVGYYEVVYIKGKLVGLKPALISGNPSPNCATDTVTLLGSDNSASNVLNLKHAVTRMGYLVKQGESITGYWSTYNFVDIGDTTATWSD